MSSRVYKLHKKSMQDNRVLKKASETMNTAFFANIKKVKDFVGIKSENSAVIYSGKSLPAKKENGAYICWKELYSTPASQQSDSDLCKCRCCRLHSCIIQLIHLISF